MGLTLIYGCRKQNTTVIVNLPLQHCIALKSHTVAVCILLLLQSA